MPTDPLANLLAGTPLAKKNNRGGPSMRNQIKSASNKARVIKLHEVAIKKVKNAKNAHKLKINGKMTNAQFNKLYNEAMSAAKNALNAANRFVTPR
jgi:hypothetical protein